MVPFGKKKQDNLFFEWKEFNDNSIISKIMDEANIWFLFQALDQMKLWRKRKNRTKEERDGGLNQNATGLNVILVYWEKRNQIAGFSCSGGSRK